MLSSAAFRPTLGTPPAPNPRVTDCPIASFPGARLRLKAWASAHMPKTGKTDFVAGTGGGLDTEPRMAGREGGRAGNGFLLSRRSLRPPRPKGARWGHATCLASAWCRKNAAPRWKMEPAKPADQPASKLRGTTKAIRQEKKKKTSDDWKRVHGSRFQPPYSLHGRGTVAYFGS